MGGGGWLGSMMHSSMVRRFCKSKGNNRHDAIQEKAVTAAGIGCPIRKLGLRPCRACSAPCHGGPSRIRSSQAMCTALLALGPGTKAEPVPHMQLIGAVTPTCPSFSSKGSFLILYSYTNVFPLCVHTPVGAQIHTHTRSQSGIIWCRSP